MITLAIIAVVIGINGTLAIHWELVWLIRKSKKDHLMGLRIIQNVVFLRATLIISKFKVMMSIYGSWREDGEKPWETSMNILILNLSNRT